MPKQDKQALDAPVSTGVPGLDDILRGGFTRGGLYLVAGTAGTGKTTLALQFLLEGARRGETVLFVTMSETPDELRATAATHGWSLDPVSIFEVLPSERLAPEQEQSLLHPSEVELGETMQGLYERVEKDRPARVVLDGISEMRLLAQSPLRFRRQMLALKHFLTSQHCTALALDDHAFGDADPLHSIVQGVVALEQVVVGYGAERRRCCVIKMRGIDFRGGFHDFKIKTGGLTIFPRLIAAEHHKDHVVGPVPTGIAELDAMLGGGLVPGTSTLLLGSSGVGKTTVATRCVLSALERGDSVAFFTFDENRATMLSRSASLGMDLRPHLETGRLRLQQIDPAELSPGEFAAQIRASVEQDKARIVVIDSLNGYLQATPEERFLVLQMHELLAYLGQQGVVTILVLGQHGISGENLTDIDLSYLTDTIMLLRHFECGGELRKAISVIKARTSNHERTIRELQIGAPGVRIGEVLSDFQGILSGQIVFRGEVSKLFQPQARPGAD